MSGGWMVRSPSRLPAVARGGGGGCKVVVLILVVVLLHFECLRSLGWSMFGEGMLDLGLRSLVLKLWVGEWVVLVGAVVGLVLVVVCVIVLVRVM